MTSCTCLRWRLAKWWILASIAGFVYVQHFLYEVCIPAYNQDNLDDDIVQDTSVSSHGPVCPLPLQKIYNLSCERLLNGDSGYIKSLKSHKFHRRLHGCNWTSFVSNCSYLSYHHGYSGKLVTSEELEFPVAFGIKIHKDPVQVEQLLRTVYRPHNVYCIHIDLKANKTVTMPLHKLATCFENVFVIQKYRVVYSSIRQPLADIECMKKLMSTKVKWKYYLILAGQEFVIKSNLEIVQILKAMNGTNDIETYPYPKTQMKRFKIKHPIRNDKFWNVRKSYKQPFRYNITMYKGSSYAMMSRSFVNFVLTSNISKELFQWAEDTFAPEEMLWATLNALPDAPGGYNVSVKMNKREFLARATIWEQYKSQCYGKYVRWICIFSYKDLPWLMSAPEVVANKFHSEYDQLVLDCLEEWIHNKTMLGKTVNMNWFHYRNVPHMKTNI